MITLPAPFVETKYPGYFWNTDDHRLYSIKVSGILTPIKMYKELWSYSEGWRKQVLKAEHYRVSHRGERKILFTSDLKKLSLPTNHIIPINTENSNETTTK